MSDIDDLSPSEPEKTPNKVSEKFSETTKETTKEKNEEVKVEVPDMIENHSPNPVSRPGWDTSEVDQEIFEKGLAKDREKYAQDDSPYPKDYEPDQDAQNRSDEERDWSDRLGRDRGKERE